jgi:Ca-activated chloride channel homolog
MYVPKQFRRPNPRLKVFSFLVLLVSALSLNGWAQADLDMVHVPIRGPLHPSIAPGGAPELSSAEKLVKVNVDLVLVPVTITDGYNRLVQGLASDNFQVFEGKSQQQIRYFSQEDAPLSVGLVLDLSGSMKNKIDKAREAVIEFASHANPADEFFMVSFADRPQELCDFTERVEDIQSKLIFANTKGRTSLLDAIYVAVNKMRRAKYSRRVLLIISDGGDNHSRYTLSEIKSLVREADISIYGIGLYDRYFMTSEEMAGPELLEDLSKETGGTAFTIDNPGDMTYAAHSISNILRNQYLLGYQPKGSKADGKWHKIKIKFLLAGRAKKAAAHFSVHAKQGYYSRAAE